MMREPSRVESRWKTKARRQRSQRLLRSFTEAFEVIWQFWDLAMPGIYMRLKVGAGRQQRSCGL